MTVTLFVDEVQLPEFRFG